MPRPTIRKGTRLVGPARLMLAVELADLYRAGWSIRRLADHSGRGYGSVYRLLTAAGVPLRSKGGKPRPGTPV